ncbi:replicative helicase loader/inhibitor [Paenibacillus kandeliae]|uniref:replicative helicase loader/inhibitor n=1 Tax=Paenibacillus kandeliae TaxID=3231269 RepID=UPI0034582D60
MNKADIIRLFIVIKKAYPGFDHSEANVDTHLKYLADMPYTVALTNIEEHILKERFAPKVADIRAGYTADRQHDQLKSDTAKLFRQQEQWASTSVPPPKGGREQLYARLFKSGR